MSVKTNNYAANLNQSTQRGPSASIWFDCPLPILREQANEGAGGMTFYDDFTVAGNATMSSTFQGSLGQWSVYADAATTLVDDQLEGGVMGMTNTTTARGATLISAAGSFRLVTTSTLLYNQKLWFECRVGTSTVAATKHEQFFGLAIPALSSGLPRANYPITTTADTLDATNGTFIGFHRKSTAAPTDFQFCFNLAGGTVNYVTGLTTLLATALGAGLAANQFVKLGFVFDPNWQKAYVTTPTARQTAGQLIRKVIRVFVNGVELPTWLGAADIQNATAAQAFPTGFMAPCMAFGNQTSTTPGTSYQDWIQVAQMPNS